jgi:hypothetical protein
VLVAILRMGETRERPVPIPPRAPRLALDPPGPWKGPVGARFPFRVIKETDDQRQDVTSAVAVLVDNPHVAQLADVSGEPVIVARRPGKISAILGYEELTSTLTLVFESPSNPSKLEIEPGEYSLGVGATARLRLIAHYKDGISVVPSPAVVPVDEEIVLSVVGYTAEETPREVRLYPEQVTWPQLPTPDYAMFDPASGTLRGLRPTEAASQQITAAYKGREATAPVSVVARPLRLDLFPSEPVQLELSATRTAYLVDETGVLEVQAVGAEGNVELARDQLSFQSSDPEVVGVESPSGMFRAVAVGEATITARHPATTEAVLALRVIDRYTCPLVFRPEEIALAVGTRAKFDLAFLLPDGKTETILTDASASQIVFGIEKPTAVDWSPPYVSGREIADAFFVHARYSGKTAEAIIRVVPAASASEEGATLRIVPDSVKLKPLEVLTPRVEQKLSGGDKWSEVVPGLVQWSLPSDGLLWDPSVGDLPPVLSVAEGAAGPFKLEALYEEAKASMTVEVDGSEPPCRANDPDVRLEVVRDPGGTTLPEGRRQRYRVVASRGDSRALVPAVEWQSDFENEFVRWTAPVLTAVKAGHVQRLHATVGDPSHCGSRPR